MKALVMFATVALAAAAVDSNSAVGRSALRASSPTLTAVPITVPVAVFEEEVMRAMPKSATRIEPSLRGSTDAKLVSMSGHTNSYRLTVRALLTRQTFSIASGPSRKIKRRCTVGLGCPAGVW